MTTTPGDTDLKPWQRFHGGNRRPSGGTLARFAGTGEKHAERSQAALRPGHDALRESRTLFPASVVDPQDSPRLLVSGVNSAKIGASIKVGPWRGLPVYTLTLEERATCPTSCSLLDACYGNAMPFARRHRNTSSLIPHLEQELRHKAEAHRRGFAVRVHVLGDFYSAEYLLAWFRWMNTFPTLRAWGYTAHQADTKLGSWILRGNDRWPGRWAFRTSTRPSVPAEPWQATTIWRKPSTPDVPEGLVCPAQLDLTPACATCGLCWNTAAADRRIVFIGHGKRNPGRRGKGGTP